MTYEHLERFFRTERGLAGPTHIANQLGDGYTKQRVHLWKKRGIPKKVADRIRMMKKGMA